MGIFKETLADSIQTQLRARTLVVRGVNDDDPNNISRDNRSGLLPWYLSKNAWVKMSSFTDYNDGRVYFDGSGSVLVDTSKGNYEGDDLSKKYVLFGGSLYFQSGSNISQETLRFGVATPSAVYGGNIDRAGKSGVNHPYFRQMGIRPMPGITGVELRTLGAYGSIFETTVKFNCWDSHQLNELELLYMRPGYSVLLEWGWSQYLDYNDSLTNAKSTLREDAIKTQSYIGGTIDPFGTKLTQDIVYKQLQLLREKYRHNYDGMLGYVKNFKWKLRRDGGYDCETVLISMGEVINTIKMSTNSNTLRKDASFNLTKVNDSYTYDDYENILLSLKALQEGFIFGDFQSINESQYSGSWNYDINYVNPRDVEEKLKKSKYPDQAKRLADQPYFKYVISDPDGDSYVGSKYEYITLDVWLAIIGSYCNLKQKSKSEAVSDVVRLLVPTDTDYCLAGPDTISIDAGVCLVKNEGAFAKEFGVLSIPDFNPKVSGANPPIFYRSGDTTNVITNEENLQFFDKTAKNGKLKNILLNIDLLLGIYRSIKSSDYDNGVVMVDYIKSVMHKVSTSLGGLNNFIVSTAGLNQNQAQIVDTYYLNKQPKDTFYEFDLLGLGSICKNVDIESQIFENQSTIVGIAAQSKANLGDVYNSSQVYLNAGLTDRLSKEKGQGEEINGKNAKYFLNTQESSFYRKVLQLMVYARDYMVGYGGKNVLQIEGGRVGRNVNSSFLINQNDRSLSTPSTLLKQSLLRFDGDLGFKALIPFKLRITLEGIGGIVVGQIFRIKQNVIPKNYYDKNLGFVITQINHSLKDNQWETTLETQICILEDKRYLDFNNFITQDRGGFKTFVEKVKTIAILYPILIDFIKFQTVKSLVGYLYSSENEGSFSNIIDKYLASYDEGDVTLFWKNNNQGFLKSNDLNQFPIDDFGNFVKKWTNNWLTIYGNAETTPGSGILNKDILFTDTQTIEQILNTIGEEGYPVGIIPGEAFEGWNNELIYKTNQVMTSNLNYFYPYKNQRSFYNNDGSQIRIKEVIFKTQVPETSQPNQSTGGGGGITKVNYYYQLNNSQLDTNIKNFLDIAQDNTGNNPFRIIKEAYEAGLGLENGQSLNDFFFYDSYVMYGKSNSLGHPFYDYQNTTNIYNQIWMLESGNTENSITETQKAFGNKINWTEKYLNIDPVTQTQNSSAFIYTNRYKNVVPLTNPQKTDILNNPPTKFQ
jgi:hypothetical protein